MRKLRLLCGLAALAVSPLLCADDTGNGRGTMQAALSGAREIPVNLSTGKGRMMLKVSEAPASISITIQYSNMTGNATAAHLHLGNRWENGPVIVPICGSAGRVCPTQGNEQTFTFPLTGNAIISAPGFMADVATLIRALESGVVYFNVHTAAFPNGEIRGQVGRGIGRSTGDNPGRGNGKGKPDQDEE